MDCHWIRHAGAAEAIVVFGGWAIGPDVFGRLEGAFDVLFVSDYRELSMDLPDLSGYGTVRLLAWSFGVAAYAHWQQGRADPFHGKVAVNGTVTPVNRATGIPPVAMKRTIETLDYEAYQIFCSRVFGGQAPPHEIDVPARRAELAAVAQRGDAPFVTFDRIWISGRDKIFPPANQQRAWAGQTISEIDAAHAPFDQFACWDDLWTSPTHD